MAAAPAAEPARSCLRCRDFDAAFELCRNRPRAPEPRHVAASVGAARRPGARAQRAVGRRRLCADFPGAPAGGSGHGGGPRRDRSRAGAAEAVPGLRARPALGHRRQQCGAAGIVRQCRCRSAGAAGQRHASVAASARARAADRQSRRVARASVAPLAPSGRAHRRSRVDRSAPRGERVSGARGKARAGGRPRTRHRGAVSRSRPAAMCCLSSA